MLTSVAIFLPILFMEGLEGQLFKDLAITMSVSHAASLLVAMTVIPAANRWALAQRHPGRPAPALVEGDGGVRDASDRQHARARWIWIGALTAVSTLFIVLFAPKVDYLPVAQTDMIWNNFRLPPGGNLETARTEFAPIVIERLRPYLEGKKQPAIKYYNFSAFDGFGGTDRDLPDGSARHPGDRAADARRDHGRLPRYAGVRAARLAALGRRQQRARDPRVLPGRRPDGADGFGARRGRRDPEDDPERFPQTFPGSSSTSPSCSSIPDEWRIARSGLTRTEVAASVRAFTGGLWAGEYFDGNERLDIIVKANEWRTPEELAELPIVTPDSGVQTVGELASIRQTVGPSQLAAHQRTPHRQRQLRAARGHDARRGPHSGCDQDVEPKVRATMGPQTQLTYAGSANDLHEALAAMAQNFVLALLILFALMAALFRSVRDSVLVMLVMPASIAGGIAALRVIGLFGFQALDLLTMIGFIILLGLVVNAAILLVDQTRARERHGVAAQAGGARGARDSRAADRAVDADRGARHGAADLHAGSRRGGLSRSRGGRRPAAWWSARLFTWVLMPALLRLGEERSAATSVARRSRALQVRPVIRIQEDPES